ncbi:hypothetical protein [Methylobacter sp. S3L5C]|uniref:hypothetical protein n=1 Tax=Methylobacter sp. S3L5C TaxID=2839024 RepID=UPI001FAD4306|nr:hypothetical protein [Methylobacter sp. S3L5C]UOA09469.1 hypothetical protein KKZ03_04000 [Methylobacter sp. S3L5C]
MTLKNSFSPYFKSLVLPLLATASDTYSAEVAKSDTAQNSWAFNKSYDFSFGDIAGKMRNFPMAFNGHFDAHYERFRC